MGLELRPTELLIFGNAKGGTPLMQAKQTIGIDLPLKALVWQDASGSTWLSYNDPRWLAERHGLGREVEAMVSAMTAALDAVARAATSLLALRTSTLGTERNRTGSTSPTETRAARVSVEPRRACTALS